VKRFTLDEANALIPELTRRLMAARAELDPLYETVLAANNDLLDREWKLRHAREEGAPRLSLTELQAEWDEAAAHLVACKEHFAERQEAWLRLLSRMGLVVRDLRNGWVDIPAHGSAVARCYCWAVGEPEISYWHDADDHSVEDRKPLTERA
jgi:hypothetical protein